jgi:hypothetical protein
MACRTVEGAGGARVIVCGPRPRRCRCACGSVATLLCDWKVGDSTCDAAICAACAYAVAADKHLCVAHQVAYREWLAARAVRERPPEHLCHAEGCALAVPPRLLMCKRHWRLVPRKLQQDVLREYRPGQETDKRPSEAYLVVMRAAIDAVASRESAIAGGQSASPRGSSRPAQIKMKL